MTSHLSDEQLAGFRARLTAEAESLAADHERQMEIVRAYTQGSPEHAEPSEDTADQGQDAFEQERHLSLAQTLQDQLVQVQRALKRMDNGMYGVCEECGNPIPVERLEALPSATLCIKHASAQRGRA